MHMESFQSAASMPEKNQIKNNNFTVRLSPDFFYDTSIKSCFFIYRQLIQKEGLLQLSHLIFSLKVVLLGGFNQLFRIDYIP